MDRLSSFERCWSSLLRLLMALRRSLFQIDKASDVHYFKLPYISNLSHHIKIKLSKLCKDFSKENFNTNLVSNSFKIKNSFSYKDPISNDLKSFLVYKFTCASCSSSYIGETCRHFKIRIEDNIKKDNKVSYFQTSTLHRNMLWLI